MKRDLKKLNNEITLKLKQPSYRRKARYITIFSLLILWMAMIFSTIEVEYDKEYTDYNHVAMYILVYNDLPQNYVPKSQGVAQGEFDVTVYAVYDNTRTPVKLPKGYNYTEAYINANVDVIGPERFVFSKDQLFYTDDHYDTFTEVTYLRLQTGYLIVSSLFWIVIIGCTTIITIMFIREVITFKNIKEDIDNDLKILRNLISKIRQRKVS